MEGVNPISKGVGGCKNVKNSIKHFDTNMHCQAQFVNGTFSQLLTLCAFAVTIKVKLSLKEEGTETSNKRPCRKKKHGRKTFIVKANQIPYMVLKC